MLIVAQIVVRKTPRFLSSVTRTYSKKTPKPWWDDRQSKITGGGHHRPGGGGGYRGTLKGHGPDTSSVQISKTISRILRHDAKSLGIPMRSDGYVRVQDLVSTYPIGFPTRILIFKSAPSTPLGQCGFSDVGEHCQEGQQAEIPPCLRGGHGCRGWRRGRRCMVDMCESRTYYRCA